MSFLYFGYVSVELLETYLYSTSWQRFTGVKGIPLYSKFERGALNTLEAFDYLDFGFVSDWSLTDASPDIRISDLIQVRGIPKIEKRCKRRMLC
jgi:hypothetical protein